MRLSISNSRYKWASVWIISLISLTLFVLAAESMLRMHGYGPTIVDDPGFWSLHRNRIGKSRKEIVLAGSSRMLTDICVHTMEKIFPEYDIVNLSIDGSCPNEVIRNLSKDKSFRGILLVDFREECLFFGYRPALTGEQFITYYNESFSLNTMIDRRIASFFQQRLIIIDPYMNIFKIIGTYILEGKFRPVRYYKTDSHRNQRVDFKLIGLKKRKNENSNKIKERNHMFATQKSKEALDSTIHNLRESVRKIQERGGKVIFLRLPVGQAVWENDEKYFPRRKYWDTTMSVIDVADIHFKDFSALRGFECPDGSHIDFRDKKKFTEELARHLAQYIGDTIEN